MRSLLGPLLNRSPIDFVPRRGYGGDRGIFGRAGTQSQMQAMGASAALFSIINRTSTATAKPEWHLHKPGTLDSVCEYGKGTEDECGEVGVEHVERHPALVPLARPNNFYTRQELFESGQQHVDLTGEGWLVIARIGNVPAELWVARPDRMVVVTDPKDFIVGYLYLGPDGREQPLRIRDVLSMRMPNPMDPYRGMGAVQTIMAQITGANYSAEWNANFYRNGARPGGIVKLSRVMSDRQFEKLVERWNYDHKGVANAGRTAFLEEGDWIDPKPMSIADMQLVETSNLNRDTVLLAFGASKYDVGVLEDVNRASATAASNDFAERMSVPRLDRWKGMLNNDYLPQYAGTDGWAFVYTSPIKKERAEKRADDLTAAQVYEILTGAGVAPDAAAEVAGLPAMEQATKPEPAPMPALPGRQQPVPDDEPVEPGNLLARIGARW